jgi:5-methylcytosine-specific restriction endonuclease McrA
MAFSETLKLAVKKRAAFRCCRCQHIGIEVHHIFPESAGGPDTDNNAAPLCPSCHAEFGDNPLKRKEIKQMRDHWYDRVSNTFSPIGGSVLEYLQSIKPSTASNNPLAMQQML